MILFKNVSGLKLKCSSWRIDIFIRRWIFIEIKAEFWFGECSVWSEQTFQKLGIKNTKKLRIFLQRLLKRLPTSNWPFIRIKVMWFLRLYFTGFLTCARAIKSIRNILGVNKQKLVAMYEEANAFVEKWTKIIRFAFINATIPLITLPFLMISYCLYFTTDLGSEAFILPFKLW